MPRMSIDDLPIERGEMLLVTFHRKTGEWWAVIGPEGGREMRVVGTGSTAIAALGEMMLDAGAVLERGDA